MPMKWLIAHAEHQYSCELPAELLHGEELPALIGGQTLMLRWHQALTTLYIRQPGSVLERSVRIRAFYSSEQGDSGEHTLIAELAGFAQPPLIATISPALIAGLSSRPRESANAPCIVRSPLTGKVLQLLKTAGQSVQRNETIAIIEAMKMENKICAPRAGTIHTLSISINSMVQVGAELAVIN
jgi:biotin carboxyl carrier protein